MPKLRPYLFLLFAFTLSISSPCTAQQPEKPPHRHGTFYFAWGYNKDWFSKSDIHFVDHTTDNYYFIVHDASAHDNPGFSKIFNNDISIPQYVYRLGYFFNDTRDLGIEINFDHAKYIVDNDKRAHITGYIREEKIDKDTLLRNNFLLFEHTNGANFLMVNIIKKKNIFESKNKKQSIDVLAKAGIGMVIPKTDVTLFGERRDNVFHVAGYIAGLETAVRWHFLKSFFLEPAVKGVYSNYTNVLTVGSARANHSFFAGEVILTGGFQVDIGGKESNTQNKK